MLCSHRLLSIAHFLLTGKKYEGFRLDNDILAICPNAAATPLLSLDKYNRFTKKRQAKNQTDFLLDEQRQMRYSYHKSILTSQRGSLL